VRFLPVSDFVPQRSGQWQPLGHYTCHISGLDSPTGKYCSSGVGAMPFTVHIRSNKALSANRLANRGVYLACHRPTRRQSTRPPMLPSSSAISPPTSLLSAPSSMRTPRSNSHLSMSSKFITKKPQGRIALSRSIYSLFLIITTQPRTSQIPMLQPPSTLSAWPT
jgi:hypothetical protein